MQLLPYGVDLKISRVNNCNGFHPMLFPYVLDNLNMNYCKSFYHVKWVGDTKT